MKVVISQAEFAVALGLTGRAVSPRPSHPILSHVLIEARKEGKVTLTGFDLSLGIKSTIPASVTKEGQTCIQMDLLERIVAHLPRDSAITMETDDNIVKLSTSSGEYSLNTQEPEDYPDFPVIDAPVIKIDQSYISHVSRGVLHAASTDESKQVLTGISIKIGAGLEAAATDGHRLAVFAVQGVSGDAPQVTVPARALKELEKLTKEQPGEPVQLSHAKGQAVFTVGTQVLTTRLLEGRYPNYRQLIPDSFTSKVTIDRQLLITALQRVAVVADKQNNVVKIDFSESRGLVQADAQDVGKGSEYVAADIDGAEITLAFNVTYLIDALKALPGEKALISCNTPTTPVVVTPCDDDHERKQLIMPVQIRV